MLWWQAMKRVVAFRPFDQQLRSAIAKRRLLQLGYKGKQRLVEPHDYGIRNGVVRILVYWLGLTVYPSQGTVWSNVYPKR